MVVKYPFKVMDLSIFLRSLFQRATIDYQVGFARCELKKLVVPSCTEKRPDSSQCDSKSPVFLQLHSPWSSLTSTSKGASYWAWGFGIPWSRYSNTCRLETFMVIEISFDRFEKDIEKEKKEGEKSDWAMFLVLIIRPNFWKSHYGPDFINLF